MKIERFEDLPIWKDARTLSQMIYEVSGPMKDFSLRDQMRRAAVSIVSNIAEGFERGSNKEFLQFLYIAKGSVGELRAQLYIAFDVKMIGEEKFSKCSLQCEQISRGISMFASYLRKSPLTRERHKYK